MDWLSGIARWIRELVASQPWLAPLQLSAERTPDWALVATVPVVVATVLLLVFIMGPRGPRKSRAKRVETQPAPIPQPVAAARAVPTPKAAALPTSEDAGRAATAEPAAATTDARATGIPADSDQDRGVRVFVSSTFLDMQGERDELVGTTFLDLRRQFREQGVELLEVDLRWGVTEQDVTLDVCLSEVNRCKPYFIGLLGQRYGTLLTDSELTPELLADFPVLRDGVGRSLTEIEIMQGVLSDPDTAKRALFFERDPAWLDTLGQEQRISFEEQSEAERAKLADLKTRIRNSVATVFEYKTPGGVGDAVKAALGAALEASFPQTEAPDAFTQTHRLHAAYARDRLGPHIGAELYLDRLDQWMSQSDAPPLLITGASGGGKSKLLAKWLQVQRANSGNDIIFAHYLGASPDSADPMQLMRRLWEHLNRATEESVDLPGGDADLMNVASGFGQRIAQANVFAERNNCHILIALDGLDKLSSESNLRWLPTVMPSRVKLVASSLDGEAKTAALTRGWSALEIKPLDAAGQSAFIASTLKLWGKSDLPRELKQRILAHTLAGLPLFLKTVLEELRVSATNAVLDARLDDYLNARAMPDLFARVLERLKRECGQALVEQALSLIEAGRAGLEEAEIIAITGATPLAWAKLRNGLGDSLRDQAGRVAFSHDYLSQAVKARYLATDDKRRAAHLAVADQFEKREPDARQAEELPFQLRAAEAWDRLEALLVDLDRFQLLRARGDGELLSFWLPLKARGRDPETLLCGAFEARAGEAERWSQEEIDLAFALGLFLHFAGATGDAHQRLHKRLTAASERVLGQEHPDTLSSMANLAAALYASGDLDGAQRLQEHLREVMTHTLGPEHPDTLTSIVNLAATLRERGDFARAQSLVTPVLEVRERKLGPDHADTLISVASVAATLEDGGDLAGAQSLRERLLNARVRLLGPEHPSTLASMHDLANILQERGDLMRAQELQERVHETMTRIFGNEHPSTLSSKSSLALMRCSQGDFTGAQELQEQVIESSMRVLGPEHRDTLSSWGNLASTLYASGDLAGAQKLLERAVEAMTRTLGPEHVNTLKFLDNLASTRGARGDLAGSQGIQERVVEIMTRTLGQEHPTTLTSRDNLAETLRRRGDLAGAQQLLAEVLEARTRLLGAEHRDTQASLSKLAATLYARGDLAGAQEFQERIVEARTQLLGPEHVDTLRAIRDLASTLGDRGDLVGAQLLDKRVLEGRMRVLGPEHSDTLSSLADLAATLYASGDLAGARRFQERLYEVRTRVLGSAHPDTIIAGENLAAIIAEMEK